jgi:Protein of unknown function (DUF2924)
MPLKQTLRLDQVDHLTTERLREEWTRLHDAPAPSISSDLLRMGLAYRLQALRFGTVNRTTRTLLMNPVRRIGADKRTATIKLSPGTKLVRDWRGVGYTVTVMEKGFDYDGKIWSSLTAIASGITGSKWNGPRFFGLTGTAR